MCEYFCIGFFEFLLKSKSLSDYLFSLKEYVNNNKIVLKYFQLLKRLRWKESIALVVASIQNLKTLTYHIFSKRC